MVSAAAIRGVVGLQITGAIRPRRGGRPGGLVSRFRGSPERDTDGTLFFAAFDPKHGEELWKSDGTEAGTVLVKDINPGPASSSPGGFANIGGTVFFSALDPLVGDELWKTDGTPEGTVLGADISPGPGSSCSSAGSSCPGRLINVNGTLFFFA